MMELDDELAEATDALLSGREMPTLEEDNRELAEVVRDLYRVITPAIPPSAAFQQRMTARLNVEWDRSNAQPTLRLVDRPLVRLAAMAAAVVLILGAVVVLAMPESPRALQGAAIGMNHGAALLVLAGVIVTGAYIYGRNRR
ncbi:MAG: hypothetical protein ABI700_33980 [Chloroflexota bacterium]